MQTSRTIKRIPFNSGIEYDVFRHKDEYCFIANNNKLVRFVNNLYRRRERKWLKSQLRKETQ